MKKVLCILFMVLSGIGCEESEETTDVGPYDDMTTTSQYKVTVNGESQFVFRADSFEVPVNYTRLDYPGGNVSIEVTAPAAIGANYTLSPKNLQLNETVAGKKLSFNINRPAYLVFETATAERLFILIDPAEASPPMPEAANVRNVADIPAMDNTGLTDMTELLQGAIDGASGTAKNIVYVPPGIYLTEALYLKDNMTLYLADGAILKNAMQANQFLSHPASLTQIEGCSRGFIVMNGVTNSHLAGRGIIDVNGAELQKSEVKMFAVKIEHSSNCTVDGIISKDSVFWNTLIFRSDQISITNFKVINNRLANDWNETDGVDFDNCTNSVLRNAFLYTGDDCMAVKSDDMPDDAEYVTTGDRTKGEYMAVDNIAHEKIVCYSGSSGCKVGTKTFGPTMSNISFKDVDIVNANRALVIDAVDTATIKNTVFQDIRIENVSGRLIDFNMDPESIFWRGVQGTCTVEDVFVTNVSADVSAQCRIGGVKRNWALLDPETDPNYDQEFFINGVTFNNFTVNGAPVVSTDDPNVNFSVNDYVSGIQFVQ